MDESANSPAEVKSIACLNKKRKSQNEPLEMPLPKHVCWSRRLGLNQIESDKFSREIESDPDSARDSNSFQCNLNSTMSTDDETKTDPGYFYKRASNEPSTSSAGTSSEIDLYSSESISLTASRSSGPDSLTISGQLDCSPSGHEGRFVEFGSHVDCSMENCGDNEVANMLYSNGIAPSSYVLSSGRWSVIQETQLEGKKLTIDTEFEQYFLGRFVEFGSHVDCGCSEYINDSRENCADNEVANMLYSNGIAPSSYVLSSGRWSVIQDTQQEGRKLTIDKEFEQYFSMLML